MIASASTWGNAAAIPQQPWSDLDTTARNRKQRAQNNRGQGPPNVHTNGIHNQTGLKVIHTETSRSCERLGCCRRGTSVPIDMESDVPRDLLVRGWRKPGGPPSRLGAWLQVVRRLGGRFNLGLPVPVGDEQSCQCRSSMIRAGPTPSQVEGARRLQVLVGSCGVLGADVLPKTADSAELGSESSGLRLPFRVRALASARAHQTPLPPPRRLVVCTVHMSRCTSATT